MVVVQVGAADAAQDRSHQNLPGAGKTGVPLLDPEIARLVDDTRTHPNSFR
jgi:hypothetical protein